MGKGGHFILRLFVSGALFASAAAKWADFHDTVKYFSGLVKTGIDPVGAVVACVICVECVMAALIMSGWKAAVVHRAVLLMLIVFTAVNVFFLFAEVSNCGCMGTKIQSSPMASVCKNIALMIALRMVEAGHPASMNPRR